MTKSKICAPTDHPVRSLATILTALHYVIKSIELINLSIVMVFTLTFMEIRQYIQTDINRRDSHTDVVIS
jgi:hypothetical protein